MAYQYKFAVWLSDEAMAIQLKAEAEKRQLSIAALTTLAFHQLLNPPPAWTPGLTGNCLRCSKVRARELAQRRAKGILPHAVRRPPPVPLPKPVKHCVICDTEFIEARNGQGHEQIYCGRGNRRCMKYVQRYGLELGRVKYAERKHLFKD